MTCREIIDFLMEYLDNALPADQRAVFERHLEVCPECRVYLDTYRESVSLAQDALRMTEDRLVESAPEELIRAVMASRLGAQGPPATRG